ncbi:MAG TPA: rRNA maturation RNase YbeY [candidate division Zixibacteria bacterium]|nr:rRNA maturation RNase YbeY [candidate division Zixibacteria bacterium]HEQ99080.1 rRNA maturation RNase YbeY [candidate division Zixibacteria bacterium]
MKVEVFNNTGQKYLPKKILAKTVNYILVSEDGDFDVNVVLTDSGKIRALNRKFRGKDSSTDVLSFAPEESDEPPPFKPIGEIYISVPDAVRQAKEAGHSLRRELLFLAAHGTLHLCGYTHETDTKYRKMMDRTEMYLERSGR